MPPSPLGLAALFVHPIAMGPLIFGLWRWLSRSEQDYRRAHRRPIFAEVVSSAVALAGSTLVYSVLINRSIGAWAYPVGPELFPLPLWGALCLAAMAPMILAFPFHPWMMRRDVIAWSSAPTDNRRPLAWYAKGVLMLLSVGVLIGGLFGAMELP